MTLLCAAKGIQELLLSGDNLSSDFLVKLAIPPLVNLVQGRYSIRVCCHGFTRLCLLFLLFPLCLFWRSCSLLTPFFLCILRSTISMRERNIHRPVAFTFSTIARHHNYRVCFTSYVILPYIHLFVLATTANDERDASNRGTASVIPMSRF